MKDYLKFKLQGAADAIINLHENLDPKFNVKAFAYYNSLGNTIDVTLYWNIAFNIENQEEVEMSKDFNGIQDFKQFCFDLCDFLDELDDYSESSDTLKAAYHSLVLKYHPDANYNDPIATENMKELTKAYNRLLSETNKNEFFSTSKFRKRSI